MLVLRDGSVAENYGAAYNPGYTIGDICSLCTICSFAFRMSGQTRLRSDVWINGVYLALPTKRLHCPPYVFRLDTLP